MNPCVLCGEPLTSYDLLFLNYPFDAFGVCLRCAVEEEEELVTPEPLEYTQHPEE